MKSPFLNQSRVLELTQAFKKEFVPNLKSGDTVKITQTVSEGNKERLQIFGGLVIRVDRRQSLTARITVRKISSNVAVERSFLIHSPKITKIEIVKRARVRRNYLSYMRHRTGKAARLKSLDFDSVKVNQAPAKSSKPVPKPKAELDSTTKIKPSPDKTPATPKAKVDTNSKPVEKDKVQTVPASETSTNS